MEENFLKLNTRMHVKNLKLMLGLGPPWWPSNAGDPVSIPGSGRSLEKGMTTPVFLLGESHGQRSLEGYRP